MLGIFALFLFYEKMLIRNSLKYLRMTELLILLTPLPSYWDYRHTLPCLA